MRLFVLWQRYSKSKPKIHPICIRHNFRLLFSIIQPVMFTLDYPPLDFFICQCWHGQALYWAMIFVSVYNLVLIAFERFLAICKPLHHERFSERKFRNIISGFYLYSFTIGQAGSYFQVRQKMSFNPVCKSVFVFLKAYLNSVIKILCLKVFES